MKIAVIGGNLLGCATTLDLALVQEHDDRAVTDAADKFELTLFEKNHRLGGNDFKSIQIDDDLHVEVGAYRTFPLLQGAFLSDLIAAANDNRGTFPLFGKRYSIPGATVPRRGKHNAAPVLHPWRKGTYRKLIRTFAAWDWKDDAYNLMYSGWSALDLIHRILDNNLWRSLALAGLLYSLNILQQTVGRLPRAMALIQCCVLFAIFVLSPKRVVAYWQHHYSFWGTTIPLLFKHGITPAISRGSTTGLVKHIADINAKNFATCAISVGSLLQRTGLEPYMRGSGNDFVRQFKYQKDFVRKYMEPIISWAYGGSRLTEVSSLASHYAMFDGDFSNSDAKERLSQIVPDNATLCNALVDAAKATLDVEVKLECPVQAIVYDDVSKRYLVTCGNGDKVEFDGIALCASPMAGEMIIETPLGTSLQDLLGYDRDVESKAAYESQEAEYQSRQESAEEPSEGPVEPSTCSHFAVIVGRAKAGFFRFTTEERIPDDVQITHAPGLTRFERLREATVEKPGVYAVVCGNDFESSGLFSEMFEEEAEIRYYEEVSRSKYSVTALPMSKPVDECMPNVVLGNRFIYVAATRKLAKHPEMDAMSAVNAASLFSRAVQWTTSEEKDDEDGEEQRQSSDGQPGLS